MARKKEKIVVNLDLPKDDTTLTRLYLILFVSIVLGLSERFVLDCELWICTNGQWRADVHEHLLWSNRPR